MNYVESLTTLGGEEVFCGKDGSSVLYDDSPVESLFVEAGCTMDKFVYLQKQERCARFAELHVSLDGFYGSTVVLYIKTGLGYHFFQLLPGIE